MKIIFAALALAGLAATPVVQADDDADLCAICAIPVCDIDLLDPLCDALIIADFACEVCDFLGGDNPDDGGGTCFSELATVQVLQQDQTEAVVQMKDLKVGDRILTGQNQYETVYAFGHHNPTKAAEFFQIHSEISNRPLEVTADHMVFLNDKEAPVAASTVQVGDILSSPLGASKVTEITKVERTGIYAPLTTGGTLLVDGVLASSYISFSGNHNSLLSDHDMIHTTLSPYRMICSGISAKLCDTQFSNDDGMPYYVQWGLGLLHWMHSCSGLMRSAVFVGYAMLGGAFYSVELLFGAQYAPLMAFLAVLAYTSSRQTKSKAKTV